MIKGPTVQSECNNYELKTFSTIILKNSFQDKNHKCKLILERVAAAIKICFREKLDTRTHVAGKNAIPQYKFTVPLLAIQ